jgi:hypothetical protein
MGKMKKNKDDRFQEGGIRKGGVNIKPSGSRPDPPKGQQVSNNKIATIKGTLIEIGREAILNESQGFYFETVEIAGKKYSFVFMGKTVETWVSENILIKDDDYPKVRITVEKI